MLAPPRPMNRAERIVARFLVSRLGHWLGLYVLPRLDRPLLYVSRGRFSMSPGQPILLLITTGAKSGRRRATPLLFLPDSDRVIVMASNGGLDRHPAWYYNVRVHPQVTVYQGGRITSYVAREAEGEERTDLWRKASAYYMGFTLYEQWTTRRIPVMVLEPPSSKVRTHA